MAAQGSFYWNELATNDTKAAAAFYTALIGWTTQDMPMGDERTYTLWLAGGQPVGGMFPAKGDPFEGERPSWLSYIAVDDVDATVRQGRGAGWQGPGTAGRYSRCRPHRRDRRPPGCGGGADQTNIG